MASLMEFWGVEVKAGEPTKVEPKEDMILHLSQACLSELKKSEQAVVSVKVGDQKFVLGSLNSEKTPQLSFDLIFEKEFELSHNMKSGSVHCVGYQTLIPPEGDEYSSDDIGSSDDEGQPLDLTENGIIRRDPPKPAPAKAIAAKPESSGKQKVIIEEPIKDDDSDDDSFEDDSDDDISGESDSDMAGSDSDGDDTDEEEETPTPKKTSKKRPIESVSKTPVSAKKAKQGTPQKTDGKNVHNATPHPTKKREEKGKPETPKSGGDHTCKSCSKTFGSDGALSSHSKAKHGAK